eukprot:TRINITY_DN59866_c0_g1_i1.p2 TRINITY_DN59866_c0_g1~~TRINITY_DN59866_c0_g1_i1.p2  ORF type:complete len:119 (-),score=13.93 TRINITY_DN59866_c0_g1_i1:7-363(-)
MDCQAASMKNTRMAFTAAALAWNGVSRSITDKAPSVFADVVFVHERRQQFSSWGGTSSDTRDDESDFGSISSGSFSELKLNNMSERNGLRALTGLGTTRGADNPSTRGACILPTEKKQ